MISTALAICAFAGNKRLPNYDRDVSHIPAESEANKKIDFSHINGSVVAYSPSEDKVFIGSPHMVILPDGTYVACHDIFGKNWGERRNGCVALVYHSKDKGKTWQFVSRVNEMFWCQLLYINDTLYMLGTGFDSNRGLLIRKSLDYGKTWSEIKDSKSGVITKNGITTPTPIAIANGRIYMHIEQSRPKPERAKMWAHQYSYVMSAPVDSDLLNADSWTSSNKVIIPDGMVNLTHGGWLEGNVVQRRSDGKIFNILRVHGNSDEIAAFYEVSADGKKATLKHNDMFLRLSGACKKFFIVYDEKTKKYFALSNYILERYRGEVKNCPHKIKCERTRNTLALLESKDLMNWKVKSVILTDHDIEHSGFQYPTMIIDGDDLIALVRTAFRVNNSIADSQHNSNLITFHRIKNFRDRTMQSKPLMGEIPTTLER